MTVELLRYAKSYLLALIFVAIATLTAIIIDSLGVSNFFFIFVTAVGLSAFYGGTTSGLVATALAIVALAFFLLPPRYVLAVYPENVFLLLLFTLVSMLLTVLIGQRHRSEQRFRATFEQAAVGMAHVGLDGRWLNFNDRLTQIVGYSRDELATMTFQDITYPDDLEVDLGYVRQLRAGRIGTYTLDKRYVCKDGSVVWVALTVSAVRAPSGQPRYYISVVEDIQARKQAEANYQRLNAELEQRIAERTAQLTEAVEQLEAFTYTVSHDLRAPLRAVQGYSNIFIEDYADVLDETGLQYARSLVDASVRMDTLIQDLLTYSRLTRAEIRLQPVALNALVEDVCKTVESMLEAQGGTIHIPPNLPTVLAHRNTLEQVITNLVTNAIKFVAPGVAPQINLYAQVNGKWVRLWVEDNGIGIAPEHQGRIFRIFERLHGIEAYPGTGIGLSIVQKGIERMGGRVGIESAPGQGSRFWIELPRADDAP